MEIREIEAILEGVLFAAGDAVEIEKLADIVDVDRRSLRGILKKMMDDYDYQRRGIHIIRLEDSYQMCTRGEYQEYISRLAEPRRKQSLSGAALEVLAIVAYKQPVTRSTVEHLRGVNCDYIVNRLIERSLIEEVGRLDAPGRPILFGTTQEFLRCFGIATLDDLPDFESFGDPAEEGSQIEMNFDNAEAQDTTPTPEDEQPGIMMNQMETLRQPLNSNTPDVPPPSAQDIAD